MPEWEKLREGITKKSLARDPKSGLQVDLLRLEPGFVDKPHFHGNFEWVYILEGSMEDERGVHVKGDFLVNGKGGPHRPSSKEGCLLLIVWSGKVRG